MNIEIKPIQFKGNIATTIAEYKAITAKRGFGVFDPPELTPKEQVERQKDLISGRLANESKEIIEQANLVHTSLSKKFLDAVYDYNHPEHLKARKQFAENFMGDPERVRGYFKNAVYNQYGIGVAHVQNTAYEKKLLTPSRIETAAEGARHKGFCDLLKAKWDAVGYPGDKELIEDFDVAYPGTIDYTRLASFSQALPPRFDSTFAK